ncbi:hypothetical protein ACOSQ4_022912 [Xanthoceras sorbifolium]
MVDDRVCNTIINARHDLMVQFKIGWTEEWKLDAWIVDFRELVRKVNPDEAIQVESERPNR